MKKFQSLFLSMSIAMISLSSAFAAEDAARESARISERTQVVLTCTPRDADSNRSGLENVVVTKHVWGCDNTGTHPHCFAMGFYFTAQVTVNVPFDNFVSQTYRISPPGAVVPGRGTVYEGKGFKLDLGPVVLHRRAHLDAEMKAQGGYPADRISAEVTCK